MSAASRFPTGPGRPPVAVVVTVVVAVLALASASGCGLVADGSDGGDQPTGAGRGPQSDEVTGDGRATAGGAAEVLDVAAETVPVRPEVVIPSSWDSPIEEVYGRYWLYWEAFAAAHAPPNADPTFQPLRELSTEENWESVQAQLSAFAQDGLVLVLPENSKSEHLIRLPNATVLTREEGAEVVLQDCWIDDFVQQTVDRQVLLETEEAKLMNVTMRVVDGQWRVDGVARATAESDGFEQCVTLVSQ